MKIKDLGEKNLIKKIIEKTEKQQSKYYLQNQINKIGDDAALIDLGEKYLAISTDTIYQKTHLPPAMTAEEIGSKIITVNISDLAATGATPIGITISLGLPCEMKLDYFNRIIDGILTTCQKYNVPLIGGDTNESDELNLSGTILGEVDKDNVLTKPVLEVNDKIAVTGSLGLSGAGFEYLKTADENNEKFNIAIDHALRPKAKLNEGIKLSKIDYIKGATDITDGLASELKDLIDSSKKQANNKVGIRIYKDLLPIPSEVLEIANIIKDDPLNLVLHYGEDFELVIVVKKDTVVDESLNLFVIGEVTDTGIIEIESDGLIKKLSSNGYQHFR